MRISKEQEAAMIQAGAVVGPLAQLPSTTQDQPSLQACATVVVKQSIWIPGWFPTPLNALMGHYGKRSRLKKKDREKVCEAVMLSGTTAPRGKREVDLMLLLPKGKRAADPDAYWKTILDALVQAGVLIDDSRRWCEPGMVKFGRSDGMFGGTLIILEDVQ